MSTVNHVHRILLIVPCLIFSACSETVVKDDPSSASTEQAATTVSAPLLSTGEQDVESAEIQQASAPGAQSDSERTPVGQANSNTSAISTADGLQSDLEQNSAENMSETTPAGSFAETLDGTLNIEQTTHIDETLGQSTTETVTDSTGESTTPNVDVTQNPEAAEAPVAASDHANVIATSTDEKVETVSPDVDTDTVQPDENDSAETNVSATPDAEQMNDPDSGVSEPSPDSTNQVSASDENLPAPAQQASGEANAAVDCRQTVPCQWTSEDSQFTVSVTNADNISSAGNLVVQFSISARHDSQVSIARAEHALDAKGKGFEPIGQALGDGNGVTPQTVVAGEKLEGSLSFDDVSQDVALSEWAVALIDGGMIRSARFTNIPVGPLTTRPTDCNNTLPCVWESPDEQVKITLLSVGNISAGNRLTVNFSVET